MPSSSPTKTSSSTGSEARRRRDPAAGLPLIELEGVSLRFVSYREKYYSLKRAAIDLLLRREGGQAAEGFWALRDVSLRVGPGERLGVVGANGAGKSTLLRVLARIYPPTAGRVEVRGSVAPLIEMGAGFNPELTGLDNIYLNGAILGMGRRAMAARVDGILDFSGLREFAHTPLKYYSSGMYARLAFAIATEVEPDVLLVDEALSAGDAAFLERAKGRLMGLLDRSKAVVLVSHDLATLRDLCTRGIWLSHGQIAAEGPIDDVVDAYLASVAQAAAG